MEKCIVNVEKVGCKLSFSLFILFIFQFPILPKKCILLLLKYSLCELVYFYGYEAITFISKNITYTWL